MSLVETLQEAVKLPAVQITGLIIANYIVITGLKSHMSARRSHNYNPTMNYISRMKSSLKRRVKEKNIYYITAALTTLESIALYI